MIDWTLLIAILGTIIALSAAIATIWQGILTRKHNKLSVRPLLKTEGNYVPNNKISIMLRNAGFGPAIIKSIQIFVDGKEFICKNENIYIELLEYLDLSDIDFQYYVILPSDTFSNEESHYLLETRYSIDDAEIAKKIQQSFGRISFAIKYQSIYEEEFELINTHKIN